MKIIAVIPARFAAQRFPGKLMKPLAGKPVILHTYLAIRAMHLFDEILVATENDQIANVITKAGGRVFKSKKKHACGSDRIAEAVSDTNADIIVNVQGDEPFIHKQSLVDLLAVFKTDYKQEIDLASLMFPLTDQDDIRNPNNVKVIVDQNNFALYFSRSPIPYCRNESESQNYHKHVGVYAFRKESLLAFSRSAMTPLEQAEKIECLRYLEQGKRMKMVLTPHESVGIDTPEDLVQAEQKLQL